MFRGVSELSLDNKGRLAIPARHRDQLLAQSQGHCVITIDMQEHCLLIYPLPEWEVIEKQIEALPSFHPAARRVQRLLIGHATESLMDSHGRMLVPPPLRDYANLEKDVVLIGQGKKFELWDHGQWKTCRDQWLKEDPQILEELPPSLLSISL